MFICWCPPKGRVTDVSTTLTTCTLRVVLFFKAHKIYWFRGGFDEFPGRGVTNCVILLFFATFLEIIINFYRLSIDFSRRIFLFLQLLLTLQVSGQKCWFLSLLICWFVDNVRFLAFVIRVNILCGSRITLHLLYYSFVSFCVIIVLISMHIYLRCFRPIRGKETVVNVISSFKSNYFQKKIKIGNPMWHFKNG